MTQEQINKLVSDRMACQCKACQHQVKPYRFGASNNLVNGWAIFDQTHNTNTYVKSQKVASDIVSAFKDAVAALWPDYVLQGGIYYHKADPVLMTDEQFEQLKKDRGLENKTFNFIRFSILNSLNN